jgi:HdeA/HdeB family
MPAKGRPLALRSAASVRQPAADPPAHRAPVIELFAETEISGKEATMRHQLASVAIAAFCMAASAGGFAAQAQSTTPGAPPVTTAAAPSDAQVAPNKWNVERVRCSDLLAASDDDRATAVMFYYGYLAAKANIHVIDVSKIEDNIGKVMKQCSSAPTTTVPHAFRVALGLRK